MRHKKKYTLKAADVHRNAVALIHAELDLSGYRAALSPWLVLPLLVFASVLQTSLHGACGMLKDPPCREAARIATHALLPKRSRDLLDAVVRALRNSLPDWLPAVPLPAAIDTHHRPYWGKRGTTGSTRGKRKAGTSDFFAYATLAVFAPNGRFTVGLLQLYPGMRLTEVVGGLLGQAAAAGIGVSYLLLDKGFYAAEVVELLQQKDVPFIMPAENRKAAGHLFDPATPVGFYDYGWTGDIRHVDPETGKRRKTGKVSVRVKGVVARHKKTGEPLVYATSGLAGWSPAQVASAYRRRFGIETNYRQLGSCLARTSSTCERYRLLLVGIALVLCNLWALVHSELFGEGPRGDRYLHLAAARLAAICAAVAAYIAGLFGGWVDEWTTQRKTPERFAQTE